MVSYRKRRLTIGVVLPVCRLDGYYDGTLRAHTLTRHQLGRTRRSLSNPPLGSVRRGICQCSGAHSDAQNTDKRPT